MQIKACHIAHQTWPSICGSVSRLENILASQKKAGIDVFVISSPFQAGETSNRTERNNDVEYYRCNSANRGREGIKNHRTLLERIKRAFSIISYTKNIIDICKRENPDVIHAHATFLMGIPALLAGFILKKRVVYEMRSTWEDDIHGGAFINFQRRIIKFLESFTGMKSDYIFFVSKGIMLHYYSPPPKNYSIIYNCVLQPFIQHEEIKTPKEIHSFGYIGSIVDYEGLETLIKAASLLLKLRSDFHINIYGDGKERISLEAFAKEVGVSNVVTFHGRVDFSDIRDAYSNIDTVVLPRKDLPITQKVAGLKPVEAFAYKKMVLASDVGGMRELFTDKVHGYLLEPGNAEKFSEYMSMAIDDKLSANKITDVAFEYYVEKFTLESMGTQYLESYKKVLAK